MEINTREHRCAWSHFFAFTWIAEFMFSTRFLKRIHTKLFTSFFI